jgi:hypothetical protein
VTGNPSTDYAEWITRNPPPNSQELVAKYGSYTAIPRQAWAEFDAARAQWEEARKLRIKG